MKEDKIYDPYMIAQQMSKTKKCPFSTFIGYVNKFATALGPKVNEVQLSSSYNIADILRDNDQGLGVSSLTIKQKAKIAKHIHDIKFLEDEVYYIIQNILGTERLREKLEKIGLRYDLHNLDDREEWGNVFVQLRQTVMINEMTKREYQKSDSLQFYHTQYVARTHSIFSRGGEQTFGEIFTQGVGDGFVNIWSIVFNLPEIFETKHKRLPNAQEYAALVRKNIKSMIKPLASLHLESLVHVIRPEDSVVDITILANNSLEMNKSDFVLDDKDYIQVNNSYLVKKQDRLLEMYREYETAHAMMPDYPINEFSIKTGCPALRAKVHENKFVIDQFCDDILELLDKIYFIHWDEHI